MAYKLPMLHRTPIERRAQDGTPSWLTQLRPSPRSRHSGSRIMAARLVRQQPTHAAAAPRRATPRAAPRTLCVCVCVCVCVCWVCCPGWKPRGHTGRLLAAWVRVRIVNGRLSCCCCCCLSIKPSLSLSGLRFTRLWCWFALSVRLFSAAF